MIPLQMVDLQSQYKRLKPEIDNAIFNVIESAAFIKGPQVEEFEQNLAAYLGVKHVIACANGTDALMLALMALGLKPGDEVIVPSFTFIATAETVAFLGLTPVFADVEPDTFIIDAKNLKKLISPRTKAIIPVHLFGQCANMTELLGIADKYGLDIIEDAAQCLGANFYFPCGSAKKAGTLGKIGCTSFFPSKNLGCFGDGGALFTNNDSLAEKLRLLANHGMKLRYQYESTGINSRLDTIQAAILNVKLAHLDDFNKARQQAAKFYDMALSEINDIEIPVKAKFSTHVYHQYTLKIKKGQRDALKKHIDEKSIPSMVYYPQPLHLQKVFANYAGNLPVTESLCSQVLSLPMHTELNENQLEYICNGIKSFF